MKISLQQQIDAVAIARDWFGQRGGDPASLAAAAVTLTWLRDNEKALRCIAGSLAAIKKDPAVRAVLATWPQAQITAIRETPAP